MASPGAMPAACGLKITMACIPSRIPALSDSRSPPSMLLSLGYLPEAEAYAGYSQRLRWRRDSLAVRIVADIVSLPWWISTTSPLRKAPRRTIPATAIAPL